MTTAIISDLHGNAVALQKVLEDIKSEKIHNIIIAGDFVGYYYRSDSIFKLLNSWEWEGIRGNHDTLLLDFASGKKERMESYRFVYGSSLDVANKNLKDKHKKFLFSLPPKKEIIRNNKKILICHGSPWDPDRLIYPDASSETFNRIANLGYDFVIMGHTHYPLIKKINKTIIINPGSVGQPRDEGSNASWASVDFGSTEAEIRRIKFPPEEVIKDIDAHDPHLKYLREVLTRTKSQYAA